jgi:hypothetical protein
MTGRIKLTMSWGNARKHGFISYPWWDIVIESSEYEKGNGYGIAKARLSRDALAQFIHRYIVYERLIDEVMGRKKEFDIWLKSVMSEMEKVSLTSYDTELVENLRKDMKSYQKWNTELYLPFFSEWIDDNKNKHRDKKHFKLPSSYYELKPELHLTKEGFLKDVEN